MHTRIEVIPKEILGPFGVPALGWLVLRASLRELKDWQLGLLEANALGVGRNKLGRECGQSQTEMNHRGSRVNAALGASHVSHSVRIAREANLLDTPLDLPAVKNPTTLLTEEQYRALDLTSGGLTNEQAGTLMDGRSAGAITGLLGRAYKNLGVCSSPQAVTVAYELGIFRPLTSEQLEPYTRYFD